ncbi:M24 family metallopeptidase [Paenibacillus gorillae]|uniref:M24 family metallopeptidase n=1 Tax=Paenibacillus gorillae TaxID=1243662 RepID=UPI0004AEF3A4|nr:Xaa-Pro peptidase family protein [Paenibacillus gorillae]
MTGQSVWQSRKQSLLGYMKQNAIDLAMITSPTNVYYFTGFYCNPHERFLAFTLDAATGEEKLYMPLLDLPEAEKHADPHSTVPISDTDNAYDVLKKYTTGSERSIGIEKEAVSVAKAERLQSAFPEGSFVDLEAFILSLRMKKSEDEIAKVRTAVHMVEQVVAHTVSRAAVGVTEIELTAELEYQMRKLGADRPAFESIVLTGARSALPHGVPGPYKLENGHFLLIDIGVQEGGYCSDITRTFVIGEPSQAQRDIYDAVLTANKAGIAAACAGVPLSAVDQAAREAITQRGFGPLFTHRVGHGFGMDVHEQPSVSGQNHTIIEPGLLFTVEPGVYDPIVGGVRIEDDVYIRADGTADVLTSYPKELTIIGG